MQKKLLKLKVIFIVLIFIFGSISLVKAGPYLSSAHGNTLYGVQRVNRSDVACGNCGHCHDQHAEVVGQSNGGPYKFALFSQNFNSTATTAPYSSSDSICFLCHGGTYQSGGIINYDYTKTYGGYSGGPISILDAFNQVSTYSTASYHNLYDIYNFASQNFSFFTTYSNPCVACHNPHRAKRVQGDPKNPASNTAVSLPTDHESLWGDDSNETMNALATSYGLKYQAPYYYGTTLYEPGGTTDYTGSTLPDYATFCTKCHNTSNTIYSTELGSNLRLIDWFRGGGDTATGPPYPDKHGVNTATVSTLLRAPFNNSTVGTLVLSCTDCHEPHGSPNPYLIRREVNGIAVTINGTSGNEIGYLCRACHLDDAAANAGTLDVNGWYYAHHSDPTDAPYPGPPSGCGWCHGAGVAPIPCLNCHKHGSDDSWVSTVGKTPTGRICF